jgi:hypothetical protein
MQIKIQEIALKQYVLKTAAISEEGRIMFERQMVHGTDIDTRLFHCRSDTNINSVFLPPSRRFL